MRDEKWATRNRHTVHQKVRNLFDITIPHFVKIGTKRGREMSLYAASCRDPVIPLSLSIKWNIRRDNELYLRSRRMKLRWYLSVESHRQNFTINAVKISSKFLLKFYLLNVSLSNINLMDLSKRFNTIIFIIWLKYRHNSLFFRFWSFYHILLIFFNYIHSSHYIEIIWMYDIIESHRNFSEKFRSCKITFNSINKITFNSIHSITFNERTNLFKHIFFSLYDFNSNVVRK